ncbi:MAG: fibronectin type III domain-containing protein [Muribaculaceae bacterium]|nr:fibronectin type III domain-containing protein [Muribaculaceae bacterium]
MKKILTLAVAAAATLAANAADFAVYSNGVMSPDVQKFDWWNSATNDAAAAPDGSATTFKFSVKGGGAAGSMGLNCSNGSITGPLHSANLKLNWYAEGTAKYTIRLTGGVEENYSFTVNADNAGKWNETILSVAETYPGVAKAWEEYGKGAGGYVFSVVAENASSDAAIYFKDVVYTDIDESWTAPALPTLPEPTSVPSPAIAAKDVVSVFGSGYTPACTFGIGGWGQSTQYEVVNIDGRQAAKLTLFNYLGWELNPHLDLTGYEYMHVDFFPCEETNFGFTPISPGKEKPWIASEVKVGEWNSYDVALSHWDNVEMNDVFQIKFDQGNTGAQCYIGNVYFWKDTRVIPAISLEVTEITTNSATVKYTVTLPEGLEGADVKVFMGDTDVTSADGLYTIEGLEAYTDYTFNFKAMATLNGTEYASDETPVSFKTYREAGAAIVKYFITNGFVLNGLRPGEPEAARRELPVSMLAEAIYNADKTITVNFSVNGMDKIVGMVPEVNIGGEWSGSLMGKDTNGVYTYTSTKTFEEGEKPADMFFWMAYAGGVDRFNMNYTVGETNEPVAYGPVAAVVLKAKSTDVAANVAVPLTYYAADAEGNFLLNENVALSLVSGNATLEGDLVTLGGRGSAVIEAVCGDFSAEVTINCLTSAEATNVAAGILGVASEAAINNPAFATDDNEGTQLEFSCADTEEHSFALDLGKNHDIEVIEVVWEGASATAYTITVEADLPAEAVVARAKAETKTYTVTDGEGGAGVTARKQFIEETPVSGRYVTLNTSKAFNAGWGIKLKELRVMGKESSGTVGIDAIEADSAAPARFFRLDGVEMSGELPAGIYVKLQGSKATKVVVR